MVRQPTTGPGRWEQERSEGGFTLLELLIVVAILGILAAIAIPVYGRFRERAMAAGVASNLRHFGQAFHAYAIEHGRYPDDSHIVLPPGTGLEETIDVDLWLAETPLGGNYNWEGPDFYPYAGVALEGVTNVRAMRIVDRLLDDGDLAVGKFRQTPNGRYTYILDE